MSNTIKKGRNNTTIEISGIDSDWAWSDSFPNYPHGIALFSIEFKPGQANDACVICDEKGDVPALINCTCRDVYDDKVKYFPPGIRYFPKLTYASGTYSANARVIIQIRPL